MASGRPGVGPGSWTSSCYRFGNFGRGKSHAFGLFEVNFTKISGGTQMVFASGSAGFRRFGSRFRLPGSLGPLVSSAGALRLRKLVKTTGDTCNWTAGTDYEDWLTSKTFGTVA